MMELTDVKTEVPACRNDTKLMTGDNSERRNEAESADGDAINQNACMRHYADMKNLLKTHMNKIIIFRNILLLIAYFTYFIFALVYRVGDEGSWRLIGFTIFGVLLLLWNLQKQTPLWIKLNSAAGVISVAYSRGNRSRIFRWMLYVAMTLLAVTYVIAAVAIKNPENLRSLLGLALFPFGLFLYSNNKRKVNWHTVFWGMSIQFLMALFILKTSWGASILRWVGDRLGEFLDNADAGSAFMFGPKWSDHPFAFNTMVKIIFVIIGLSVVNYLGVVSFIVETGGRALAFCLETSPSEGVNSVGNIFLHIPESIMAIQTYLEGMTPSQLFVTYSGALATVGGSSLAVFISFGVPAGPLVAASAMSAPAALAAAKLVFPSHDAEEIPQSKTGTKDKSDQFLRKPNSVIDAMIIGINQGALLAVSIAAYLTAFVICLEFINNTLQWFGDRVGIDDLTIELIFSYIFYPFAFLMGARHGDCLKIGELLGVRTFSIAVIAYGRLGPIIENGNVYRQYVAENANNTWTKVGNDIFLETTKQTLVGGVLDPRSELIATYSLCGSASVAILGVVLASFQKVLPQRMNEITKNLFRSFVVGTVASYLTACFAGLLYDENIGY